MKKERKTEWRQKAEKTKKAKKANKRIQRKIEKSEIRINSKKR